MMQNVYLRMLLLLLVTRCDLQIHVPHLQRQRALLACLAAPAV
jgi:hypothetical protein